MFFALFAYLSVFIVSSFYELAGLMVAIITVLQLPPRESFSILVSLESLKGTKKPFFVLSPRALMQFANARREVLIFAPSLNLMPLFSVTVPLSEPARSISDNFPQRTYSSVFLVLSFTLSWIWKMACEREEVWFALVDSVVLLLFPIWSKLITWLGSWTWNSVTPES